MKLARLWSGVNAGAASRAVERDAARPGNTRGTAEISGPDSHSTPAPVAEMLISTGWLPEMSIFWRPASILPNLR